MQTLHGPYPPGSSRSYFSHCTSRYMDWESWPIVLLAVQMYSPASVYWMLFRVRDDTRAWLRTTMCPSRVCQEGTKSVKAQGRTGARKPGHRLCMTSLTPSLPSLPISKFHLRYQIVGRLQRAPWELGYIQSRNWNSVYVKLPSCVPRWFGSGTIKVSQDDFVWHVQNGSKALTSRFLAEVAVPCEIREICTPFLPFQQSACLPVPLCMHTSWEIQMC